jgi:hypothetical protein
VLSQGAVRHCSRSRVALEEEEKALLEEAEEEAEEAAEEDKARCCFSQCPICGHDQSVGSYG